MGTSRSALAWTAVGFISLGCGASADQSRPPTPTYENASHTESCPVVEGRNEPFVVDWRADKRGDLEAALDKGLVVVAYDCNALRVLTDCTVSGRYSFAGVTEKEQLIRLESAEELRANLPLSGMALAGRLGGSLQRGSTLDIALALVGKKTSTRAVVQTEDLVGECIGATHFVRSATLGAFVMKTGTRAHTQALAEVFAMSAGGKGSSVEEIENRDGSVEACRTADATKDAAPPKCASPIRIELREIRKGAAAVAASKPKDTEDAPSCPKGLVAFDSGKCGLPTSQEPYLCLSNDLADCEAQCKKGSLSSCAVLGRSYQIGRGVTRDLAKSAQLLGRACDGGVAQGCGRLGEQRLAEKDLPAASKLFEKSCASGWFPACDLGAKLSFAASGTAKIDVYAMFKRACNGGEAEGCWSLGSLFDLGLGVRQNDGEALQAFQLACDGGAKLGCTSLAKLIDAGRGTTADPAKAVAILKSSCDRGYAHACSALSDHYFLGRGITKDYALGMSTLERACTGEDRASCLTLAMRYEVGMGGIAKDPVKAQRYYTRACESGVDMACEKSRKP